MIEVSTLWLIDFDDTCAPCEVHYQERARQLHDFLQAHLSGYVKTQEELWQEVQEVNSTLIRESGHQFHLSIFPTSLLTLYEDACRIYGHTPQQSERADVAFIGWSVFSPANYHNTLLPHVFSTLQFLKDQEDSVVIYTKGDQSFQRMKIQVNGLEEVLDGIKVTLQKTPKEYRELVQDRDPVRVIAVGNSIRSDINPATTAGLRSIYIPYETWSYESSHNGITHPHLVVQLENFRQIRDLYNELIHHWDAHTVLAMRR